MKRKEINIFSTSFLDLLSGALGAVLILFIIIPKITAEQRDTLEEIERLNVQTEQLVELLEQARNSIPTELFEQIQEQLHELQNTIDELTQTTQNLQQRLQNTEAENERLREQLAQTQQQLERERAQNRDAAGERMFGINAKLGVVCFWQENIDVDLYVKNITTGEICFWNNKTTDFGILMEDITSRGQNDDRYELFYQSEIIPGRYLIYVNIYHQASFDYANSATVTGYVTMFPGTRNEQKINYRQIKLTRPGVDVNVGYLTVTNNNITLQQ
ncbi:MAG: hypothetical protein LBU83_06910 [Bacteroidales bacterium]|jgi:gas vesicle protein|nr:hypothetical protein [Bacteroidales bacterium]